MEDALSQSLLTLLWIPPRAISRHTHLPVFNVRELKLTDDQLGISTALFYLTVLLGSTQLRNVVHRLGNKRTTGWGVAGLALYPIIVAYSSNVAIFYFASIVGGFAWSWVGGSDANYMLEHIPADDRPPHLAWYNIALNIAILIGSLAGPAIATQIFNHPGIDFLRHYAFCRRDRDLEVA